MLSLVNVIGMLESDKEYVRSNTVNCPLIYRPDTIMFILVNVIGMLEPDKEYVRSNTVNCPLIYRPDTIMFTLANVTGMLVEYVSTNTVNCAHIYMLRAVPEINTWGGREAPLKFTNHP